MNKAQITAIVAAITILTNVALAYSGTTNTISCNVAKVAMPIASALIQ